MVTRKLAALGVVPAALLAVAAAGAAPAHAAPDAAKVWVCKYVRTPGADTEVLKAGKQPIAVSSAATVGEAFQDGQVLSLVLDVATAENTARPGNDYAGSLTCPSQPGGGDTGGGDTGGGDTGGGDTGGGDTGGGDTGGGDEPTLN